MEKIIRDTFRLGDRDVRETSALSLAFLGDAVFELIIRTVLVERGGKTHAVSTHKSRLVNAGSQARMAVYLQKAGLLTEEEQGILRRGRNASPHTLARHASVQEYHLATGLECLMGTLYLTGRTQRAAELVRLGLEGLEDGAAAGQKEKR